MSFVLLSVPNIQYKFILLVPINNFWRYIVNKVSFASSYFLNFHLKKPCIFFLIADDLDYTKIQLSNTTFFEKVHPATDELEYSGNQLTDDKFGIQLGRVKFGLQYDFDTESLEVTIFEARDLPSADEGKTIFFSAKISFDVILI